ncbi:MAG: hypothetical protein UR12_C0018G0005 [candidate division TM6 bacterium GW2011_GWF2_30_66]|nr:MAG: hypothetical protein UR12_C0018G0005 [candidate division TM6 bacterium GW2011_GWF2_30_66]
MNIKKIITSAMLITMLLAPISSFAIGGGRGGHGGGRGGRSFHGGGRGYYGHGGRGYHGRGYGYGRGWGWGLGGLGVGLGLGYLASGALDPSWNYYYGGRYWGYDDAIYGWCPYHGVDHGCYYRRTLCPVHQTYHQIWDRCPR